MTKKAWIILGAGLTAVIAAVVFIGASAILKAPSSEAAVAGPGAQVSEAGGVQVMASYDNADSKSGTVTFNVALSTHSVELGSFALAKLSRVVLEPGGTVTELTWTPKGATSGHHIEGTLTARLPVALSTVRTIALEIEGLASPEVRRFEWTTGAR